MYFPKVEKEEIPNMEFPKIDVLQGETSKRERKEKLLRATILSNSEKIKHKIIFATQDGNKCVETTIWAVTDKYICLKGGITMVIAAIMDVL